MGDGLTVTGVTGLDEVLSKLDQIPLVLSRDVARDGLQEAGEVMQAAAEANAAEHRRSGDLEEDIIVLVKLDGGFANNRVLVGPGYPGPGAKTRKRGKYAGQVDRTTSPGVYGGFVEGGHGAPGYSWASRFGTAKQRRRTGRQVELGEHDVPPHPWLKPAWETSHEEAMQGLLDRTKSRLDQLGQ